MDSSERKVYKRLWMAAARRAQTVDKDHADDSDGRSDTDTANVDVEPPQLTDHYAEQSFTNCSVELSDSAAAYDILENLDESDVECESNHEDSCVLQGSHFPAYDCFGSSSDSDNNSDHMIVVSECAFVEEQVWNCR